MCMCDCVCIPLLAEVSCRDVIKQARVTRVASSALKKLGQVNPKNSERDCHAIFRKYGQSLQIPISKMDLHSKKDFPYVKMSAWLTYLVQYDLLEHLVGCSDIAVMQTTLKRFWSLYQNSNPDHMMYHGNAGAPLCPEMTIPVVQHGDEGRSLKRKQIMVVSTTGVLGRGSSHCPGLSFNDVAEDANPLNLNMIGHTWLTHYLHGVLPINLYNETPECFFQFLSELAADFTQLFNEGVVVGKRRFFVALLGVKGDAPYLTKVGRFYRNFLRRPTRPSSKTHCAGICHLCLAGKEGPDLDLPFEEYGALQPRWLPTVGVEAPFEDPSPFLDIPIIHGDGQERMFLYDLFHNFHLGIGKTFAANAFCLLMELVQDTIAGAFASLTGDFRAYCRRTHQTPYHRRLSPTLFGVEMGFKECPEGGWSKGDFTRLLCQWLEDWCRREVVGKTELPLYLECVAL